MPNNSWNRFFRLLPPARDTSFDQTKDWRRNYSARERNLESRTSARISPPRRRNRGGPFVRLLFPGEGRPSMPIETRRNISGRHEMQCVFGVTVSGPETTRYVLRFAPQLHSQDFESWTGNTASGRLFRDFQSSLTLARFPSFSRLFRCARK